MSAPHYVYVLQSATEVVYVGCTSNIGKRLSEHQRKPWWPDIITIDIQCYATQRAGLDAERSLIETLNPRYNTMYTNREARVLKSLAGRQAATRARHERGETCSRACNECSEKRAARTQSSREGAA